MNMVVEIAGETPGDKLQQKYERIVHDLHERVGRPRNIALKPYEHMVALSALPEMQNVLHYLVGENSFFFRASMKSKSVDLFTRIVGMSIQ